jgi:hypothetical protein
MGAPDSPVRQPRHPTVRVLTVSTVGALTSWGTGQSGAASDRYCSLSGAPSSAALTLHELSAHCAVVSRPLESTVALVSRCSAGTPDSPVNYSGVAFPETRRWQVWVDLEQTSLSNYLCWEIQPPKSFRKRFDPFPFQGPHGRRQRRWLSGCSGHHIQWRHHHTIQLIVHLKPNLPRKSLLTSHEFLCAGTMIVDDAVWMSLNIMYVEE